MRTVSYHVKLLLAAAASLLLLLAYAPAALGQKTVTLEYTVRVYATITDYYYGRPMEEHFFRVTLSPAGDGGYNVESVDYRGLGASIYNAQSLMRALSFPGEWHFALPPSVVEEAARDRNASYGNARLIYVGRDGITVPPEGLEDGVLVILSTPQGGKRILYDEETGIALREYFLIRAGLAQRSVVVVQVDKAPPIIGDEAVSEGSIAFFQAASAFITLGALAVFALRGRYRIL